MKQIQPTTIWFNGVSKTANYLSAIIIRDNLLDKANFSWFLYVDVDLTECISNGDLVLEGQEYVDWNTETDINEAAYQWVADQLNLTII
jgi:hypothetical protein